MGVILLALAALLGGVYVAFAQSPATPSGCSTCNFKHLQSYSYARDLPLTNDILGRALLSHVSAVRAPLNLIFTSSSPATALTATENVLTALRKCVSPCRGGVVCLARGEGHLFSWGGVRPSC